MPLTKHVDDDQELARLMADLPGMIYQAGAKAPFAFKLVGGGYERILGRSLDELTDRRGIRPTLMYPYDLARYQAVVERAVRDNEAFEVEYIVIHPDATERMVWEQGRPVQTADGCCFIEGSILDIQGPVHARKIQDATYRISQAAASAESLQELYAQIHQIVGELMPAENLYLALRDPKTGFITYPYYIDQYDVVPPDPQMAETGLTAHILRTGEPLLLSEFVESEPIKSGDLTPTGTSPISWLGVPLRLRGKPIGVIAVQVYHGRYRYTDRDRDILSFVADQIAVAIDRRRAADFLQESELRYRSLFEDSPVALWEEDFSELSKRLKQVLPQGKENAALWLRSHPETVHELASLVCVVDVNKAAIRIARAGQKSELVGPLSSTMPVEAFERFELELLHIAGGDLSFQWEGPGSGVHGEPMFIAMQWMVAPGGEENLHRVLVAMVDVSDRIAAETALRDSEARMRALFSAMNDIIVILDRGGRCIEVISTGASRQYSPDRIAGRSVSDTFSPQAAETVLVQIQKALDDHMTTETGFSNDIAGSLHWFEVHISPLSDERVLMVAHDATARHEAQEAARIEASKAESYFNTSGVIMEVTDLDLHLVRLNRKGYEFFGYAPDEIVGREWFDIKLPEREREKTKSAIRRELAGAFLPNYTEGPVVTRTGEERIVAWHDSLLRDSDGRVTGLISSGVDVTDRVHAEHALQASELKFKELFNQARDAIILHITNDDGTMGLFIEANDVACEWTGYTRDELQHMNVADIMVTSTPGLLEQAGQQLNEHGKTTFGVQLKVRDGHRIPAEVSASAFKLEGRTVVMSILRDITERLRLESELQRIDKLESLGTLAGGIAHDFNNMMTGIVGNINLARIEDDRGRARELLEEAEREVLQARGLTQQLLTFAKGGAPLRSVQNVSHILRESVSFALRGSDVSASFDLPLDLSWADVDGGQIGQVFSNIAINADEAMPAGGTLLVSARNVTFIHPVPYPDLAPGNYVRIDISDTGIGIAEADLRKIFDPFFSTKRRGSGLGLATSYAIVQKHDGYIAVSSTLGVGTTFSIFLPASPAKPSPQHSDMSTGFTGHGRVLVMDDELAVRQVVVAMLMRLGYEAEAVSDGAAALRADAEATGAGRPFSVIIMDLTIPGGMGGQETAALLRENHTPSLLIASSGYATDPIMGHYREYHFDGVLAKPYSFTELTSVLASLNPRLSVIDSSVGPTQITG
ncbi:MAG: PAS domain S-box protein [Candidatus Cryosericum sp.]